jgi:hypothetical protein
MRILRLTLQAAALAFALVGVGFLLARPSSGILAAPLPMLTPSTTPALTPEATIADSLSEQIVLANVFSPSRTAPLRRVYPPEFGGDSVNGMLADTAEAPAADSVAAAAGAVPALLGTMVAADGARALLRLDASSPTPQLFSVGDRAGGYRVEAIAPREVTLVGRRGRVVLRLPLKEERQ